MFEIEVDDSIESLEKSSKCDILFASYQLVSEGTDIPTLNTLIMTTPKKQIQQVVGRILRSKTEFTPLILDIVDSSFSNSLPFLDFSNFSFLSKISLIIWTIFITVGIWRSAEDYKGSIIWILATFLFLSYRVFSLRLIFFG